MLVLMKPFTSYHRSVLATTRLLNVYNNHLVISINSRIFSPSQHASGEIKGCCYDMLG